MIDQSVWIHNTSIVGKYAHIGSGTRIWQFCNVMDGAIIGKNCTLSQNVFIEDGVVIGDNVKIKNNVALYRGVICEDDVFLGPNCVFTNVLNPRSFIQRKNEFKKTLVKQGATVGANATILCGHTIGTFALIGAGAVITRDVLEYSLIVGNPGKMIGYVCECGERLEIDSTYICKRCKKQYMIQDGKLKQHMPN